MHLSTSLASILVGLCVTGTHAGLPYNNAVLGKDSCKLQLAFGDLKLTLILEREDAHHPHQPFPTGSSGGIFPTGAPPGPPPPPGATLKGRQDSGEHQHLPFPIGSVGIVPTGAPPPPPPGGKLPPPPGAPLKGRQDFPTGTSGIAFPTGAPPPPPPGGNQPPPPPGAWHPPSDGTRQLAPRWNAIEARENGFGPIRPTGAPPGSGFSTLTRRGAGSFPTAA